MNDKRIHLFLVCLLVLLLVIVFILGCAGPKGEGRSQIGALGAQMPKTDIGAARYSAILAAETPLFLDANGNNLLDAEEADTLKLTIKNSGRGASQGLILRIAAQQVVPHVTFPIKFASPI